jgi:NAD(P)-dependent dehydrogenase (short-subunit alcohol dehydrogenase family)
MAGHEVERLEAARSHILSESPNADLRVEHLDLASIASVRAFVDRLPDLGVSPVDSLVNNAGVSVPTVELRSADGYELMFAVNHLGPFLLTLLLLSRLTTNARIVFVSSAAHDPAHAGGPMRPPRHADAELLAYPERDPGSPSRPADAGGEAYGASKLCNILCTYELARRIPPGGGDGCAPGITVNAFNPGLVAGTGLGRHNRGFVRFAWFHILPFASRLIPGATTVELAAAALSRLVTDAELSCATGLYFSGTERDRSSDLSYDTECAVRLWKQSVRLAGLRGEDTPVIERTMG